MITQKLLCWTQMFPVWHLICHLSFHLSPDLSPDTWPVTFHLGHIQKPAIHWCQCGLPWTHAWCQCLPQIQSVQQRLGSNREWWILHLRRCCISTATLAPYTIQGSWKSVPSTDQLQHRSCIKAAGHWESLWSLEEKIPKTEVGIDIMDIDEINEIIMCACVLHNICILENDPTLKIRMLCLRRMTHVLTLK